MILYRDLQHVSRNVPPPWLVGARDLCTREDASGRLWSVGDPLLLGPNPHARWHDVGDKWECAILPGLSGLALARAQVWADVREVQGMNGVIWMAPQILTPMGAPGYRPALGGPNWLPIPTPEQKECQQVAEAARAALISVSTGGEAPPLAAACRWAAVLLSAANHASPEVFACGLMDEPMAVQVCAIGAGLGAGE